MLSYRTVEPHTLELLRTLTVEPLFQDLRLVGGTSLALQYGHRNSVDLDFFGLIDADADEIRKTLKSHGELTVIKESQNIKIYTLNGVKIDIVNYSYLWIDEPVKEDNLMLASPRDIAAMKVNAIEGRGTRKDFIDLAELLKHYTLQELLDFHSRKYPEANTFRAILSLSYFEDAEQQPMPTMFIPDTWEQMKAKIQKSIREYNLDIRS